MERIFGDLEEKIMNIIWEAENPLKPSEVCEKLDSNCAYTTVMTVLCRLTEKGILERSKKGKAYFYKPIKTKESFLKPKLKQIFQSIIDSYGELAVSQFVDVLDTMEKDEKTKLRKVNE